MALDQAIVDALEEAVTEADQPKSLARRLVAWVEAINGGNESLHETESTDRRLEALYAEVALPDDQEGDYDI